MLRPVLIALLVPVALLGLIVAGRVSWVAYGPAPGAEELTGQLRFLEGSLVRGDAERMQELFPEGSYFLRALTALAEAAARRRPRPGAGSAGQPGRAGVGGSSAPGWCPSTASSRPAGRWRSRWSWPGPAVTSTTRTMYAAGRAWSMRRCEEQDRVPRGLSRSVLALRLGRGRVGPRRGRGPARRARLAGHGPDLAGPGAGRGRPGDRFAAAPGGRGGRALEGPRGLRSRSSRRSGRRSAGRWTAWRIRGAGGGSGTLSWSARPG